MKKTQPWVVFQHGEKELLRFTVAGIACAEITTTKELLAYERNIPASEIRVYIRQQGSKKK